MFTRYGGVSASPFQSLNISFHSGDDDKNIITNRNRIKKALHLQTLCSVHQIHSDKITVLSSCDEKNEKKGYDAIITNTLGTGLLIQQADCQAILLYDPKQKVIAAVHSGWRGSVQNIIGKTVAKMKASFRVIPENIQAVISPSLGPCCAEFIHYREELPRWMHQYQTRRNHFNFWTISRMQLSETGIRTNNIDTAGICTCCNEDFFSYRRSMRKREKVTGRNGSVIGLPSSTV